MDPDQLIRETIDGALARTKDIREACYTKAMQSIAEEFEGRWPVGAEFGPPLRMPERPEELDAYMWSAPLTDICVMLLWAIAEKAAGGEFAADEASMAAVCAAIPDDEAVDATGIDPNDVRAVIEKTAEALLETIRTRGPFDLEIDRRTYRLRSTPA